MAWVTHNSIIPCLVCSLHSTERSTLWYLSSVCFKRCSGFKMSQLRYSDTMLNGGGWCVFLFDLLLWINTSTKMKRKVFYVILPVTPRWWSSAWVTNKVQSSILFDIGLFFDDTSSGNEDIPEDTDGEDFVSVPFTEAGMEHAVFLAKFSQLRKPESITSILVDAATIDSWWML